MAIVEGVLTNPRKGIYKQFWEALLNGDTGTTLTAPNHPDKTVQVVGTFGAGGTVILEGSNNGGDDWFTLTDPQDNVLSFTAAGGKVIMENPGMIRPNVTGGDETTDLDVAIFAV